MTGAPRDTGQPAGEVPAAEQPADEPPLSALPADPEAYDSPRATQARARGLAAPYIAGGRDPNPDEARRQERRDLRLLIAMVVVIVLSGFVLGYVALFLGMPGLLGNP